MKKLLLAAILLFLLVFRLHLAVNAKHGDMYNNIDWGRATVAMGPAAVYDAPQKSWPHSWPNQPPGSLLWHALSTVTFNAVTGSIWFLNEKFPAFPSKLIWWWELHGELLCIKLPSIIADFFAAAAIFYIGKSHGKSRLGRVSAFIYLVNPAIWYNSSYWGQTDSIIAALSIWSLAALLKGKLPASAVLLGLSLITKASWAPIIPLYFVYWLKKYPKSLPYLLLTPAVMLLVALLFHPHLDLLPWLANLFFYRILPGESAFITVLAFNFWNLIFGPAFLPHTISFLGLPANLVGWGLVGGYLVLLVSRLWKKPEPKVFLFLSALLFFAVFLFAPKMIHRYLFPVFPPLTALLIFSQAKSLWLILGVLSACFVANLYYQWWAPGIPGLTLFYTPFFTKIISVIYLSVFAALNVKKT